MLHLRAPATGAWMVAYGVAHVLVAAGPPYGYRCDRGRCAVFNDTPVRLAFLLIQRGEPTALEHVFVEPGGTAPLRRLAGDGVQVADIQILEPGISVEASEGCGVRFALPLSPAAELSERAATAARTASRIDVTGTGAAARERDATRALATLQMDDRLDTLRAAKWDRFLAQAQADALGAGSGAHVTQFSIAQDRMAAYNQELQDRFDQMSAIAMAYSQIASTYRAQLAEQARRLAGPASDAEAKRRSLAAALADAEARSRGAIAFAKSVAAEFKRNAPPPDVVVAPRSGLQRVCGEQTLFEVVEVALDAPAAVQVAAGRLRFDRGGSYETTFRRVGRSGRWRATISWPVDATSVSASVSPVGGKKWTPVPGTLRLGTMSYKRAVETASRELSKIEKMYRRAKFRAEGGESVKTIRIP